MSSHPASQHPASHHPASTRPAVSPLPGPAHPGLPARGGRVASWSLPVKIGMQVAVTLLAFVAILLSNTVINAERTQANATQRQVAGVVEHVLALEVASEQVAGAAGLDGGQCQRSDELDGDRDPERKPGQRGVEGPVHGAESQAEGDHCPPGAR